MSFPSAPCHGRPILEDSAHSPVPNARSVGSSGGSASQEPARPTPTPFHRSSARREAQIWTISASALSYADPKGTTKNPAFKKKKKWKKSEQTLEVSLSRERAGEISQYQSSQVPKQANRYEQDVLKGEVSTQSCYNRFSKIFPQKVVRQVKKCVTQTGKKKLQRLLLRVPDVGLSRQTSQQLLIQEPKKPCFKIRMCNHGSTDEKWHKLWVLELNSFDDQMAVTAGFKEKPEPAKHTANRTEQQKLGHLHFYSFWCLRAS